MSVGIVAVSHSEQIADGVVQLAAQMAGSTTIVAAGGTDEGGIGTSFDKVQTALETAQSGDGVVVLCDLGSAVMTAEMALEFLDEEAAALVRIADAPIVEGAVAAAVAAEAGASLVDVLAAAESASGAPRDAAAEARPAEREDGTASASVELPNKAGLHARPAAELVKLASTFDAAVTVNDVDAKSLLRIMALGLGQGSTIRIAASGPDAAAAVEAVRALAAGGFGEE